MSSLLPPPTRGLVEQIHPLEDPRWDEFVNRSRQSTIFHTRPWLEALRRTYGYQPLAFTTAARGEPIENSLLFCKVQSRLTGNRLVSLPFSDHCVPLGEDPRDLQFLFSEAERHLRSQNLDYIELRPADSLQPNTSLAHAEYTYCLHQIDLRPDLNTLFRSFHKDSTQRKIRRAEREGLTYQEGRSQFLLDAFYRLLLITRRRHQAPPQPRSWFRNLTDSLGERLKIRVALVNGTPAAAMLTLRHRDTLVYKYGGSDARFHHLGPVHLLFWNCIQEGKREGLRVFDLGRSNLADQGLVTFKDRWGGARSPLVYSRYGRPGRCAFGSDGSWPERLTRTAVSHLPDRLFEAVGHFLYSHIG